ncbi:HTH-type transcriptional regulator DegA [Massilia sp. Bi118]|uniref:LacI family DNA-binding transcriptional regulator n=1 Tax=Massilia sp. Bi118 TaxID=2822346 RepID=UPI001DEB366D|nr:LacI family DNA-binding transcriptional regulator [Massilia sp. Bi118]CAH0274613.1 HTH-type transcriptional regulator DegA [Massilia sp. Bi118]
MKKTAPTLRDVAAASNVSIATVSKYINGTQRFSAKVEAAMDAAIAGLGYKSNPLAKSMITGRTDTIGLSVLDITNPHFSSILKGAQRVANDHGLSVLVVDTEENPGREQRVLEDLSRRVDGMIVASRLREKDMGWMADIDKPLVFFGSLAELPLPTVASDDHGGAFMLTQHLKMLGHKRIAYLSFSKSRRDEERLGGIRECLDAAGMSLTVFNGDSPSLAEGERLCSSIVLGSNAPDALICYNDLMALGFMKEAANLGVSVPRDISVVGFDNIPYGKYVTPALTTVDLQSERMGASAMEKLLAVIRGEEVEKLTKIAPQLVLRSSTQSRT